MKTILLTVSFYFLLITVSAQDVKIASWNLKDIWNSETIEKRKTDFKDFGKDVKPDILVLQEFTEEAQVIKVSKHMGIGDYNIASTNFKNGPGASPDGFRSHFEVAIVSKYPISNVTEYACYPNRLAGSGSTELPIYPLIKGPIASTKGGRGFLWAQIDDLKLVVIGVHLKSSSGKIGEEDKGNAEKRELVASAISNVTASFLIDNPDYTVLVAGDFNVGHSDVKKNGLDIVSDCHDVTNDKDNCGTSDKYDETHALLNKGLVRNVKMKNLAIKLDDTYYDPTDRFDGGAIDNIYVIGSGVKKFEAATKSSKTYNSDHYPIWTVWKN